MFSGVLFNKQHYWCHILRIIVDFSTHDLLRYWNRQSSTPAVAKESTLVDSNCVFPTMRLP